MTDRRSRLALALLLAMTSLSLAVRLHNVAVFPEMRAPDGFGHFTYIWHLATTGTIPLPTAGWSFFHPPLYYAWMALVWNAFASLEPATRLKLGTAGIAVAGLAPAAVAWALVRRRHPERLLLQVAAPAFLLFLPVHLYSAGYLGNEALNSILCSLAVLATLRLLDAPSAVRGLVLGAVLGLAMLTKFTALAIVAGAFATIGLHALRRGRLAADAAPAAIAAAAMLAVCGWFYARNVELYGTPFQMSRDTLAVRRVENLQSQGTRGLAEFLLFDPMVVVRPQWPRGLPLTAEEPITLERSALRESVWTGMFANTFFDAVGNQVLPSVTNSEAARRAGQVLLALGLVPTLLVMLGLAATLRSLAREGWNDTDAAVLLCFSASVALFMVGAKSVPMHAAIKATYLTPASAMFAYWFASGLGVLDRRAPVLRSMAGAACVALAAASVVVFTLGTFVCRDFFDATWNNRVWQNLYGVIAWAGGDREGARQMFERSAAADWHLAHENLAALALEGGDDLEAAYRLRLAALLETKQSFGLPDDRAAFDRLSQAEYANSAGVAYYELGWIDEAATQLRASLDLDPSIPETSFDLGLVEWTLAVESPDSARRREHERSAAALFAKAAELDPGFVDAAMLASGLAPGGACREPRIPPRPTSWTSGRLYPVESGSGDMHAAAVERRRRITRLAPLLAAELAKRGCRVGDAKREAST